MKTICYLPCGYPTMEKSLELAELYLKAGCDAIEWCIPPEYAHSDPPYIAEKLQIARNHCDDYFTYFSKLEEFKQKKPDAEIILLLYQEIIEEVSPKKLIEFCKRNNIDTILSANLCNTSIKKELIEGGLKIAASMNYTMYPEEIDLICTANGFIYMQAFPTLIDLEMGRGPETLEKAIKKIRSLGIDRDIYCGVGIRKPEDIKFIKECGGQGFFLGSALLKYYDDEEKLIELIQSYKKAAE